MKKGLIKKSKGENMLFENKTVKKVILFIGFIFLHSIVIADDKKKLLEFNDTTLLENNTTLSSDIFGRNDVSLRKGNIFRGRFLLYPKKVWENYYTDYKSHYIKSIVAKVDERKVLDVHFGGYQPVYDNLQIEFKFMNFSSSKSIDYTLTGNQGKVAKKSFKLKRRPLEHLLAVDIPAKEKNNTINPKAWKATTINGAIEALYGKDILQKFLDSPKNYITYNTSFMTEDGLMYFRYAPMILKIKSKKEIDSIAFFYTGNIFPLISIFNLSSVSLPELKIVTGLLTSGNILVIAKGRDGKIYQSRPLYVDNTVVRDIYEGSSGIRFNIE